MAESPIESAPSSSTLHGLACGGDGRANSGRSGNSTFCFEWDAPIATAVAHLEAHESR